MSQTASRACLASVTWLLVCVAATAAEVKHAYTHDRGVTYSSPGGQRLKAEVYAPKGAGPFPGVLVVHGGAWRLGNRFHLAFAAERLAERGYTAVSIDDWLGGTRGEKPDVYRQASPTTHITAEDPPMFFFHGAADALVPRLSPQVMVGLLTAAKVPAKMHVIEDAGHIQAMFDAEALEASIAFLDERLQPQKK